MYFEVWKNNNLIRRGTSTLEPISFDNELMYVPTCSLVLPIDWLECFDGREEVKIYIGDKVFWGIVWDIEVDKIEEKITLDVRHVISEWQYRQISVNHAISNTALNIVYKGSEVVESGGEAITASEFSASVEQASHMTKAEIIERARAKAWLTDSGDNVPITTVLIQKCTTTDNVETCVNATMNAEDTYRITFKTAKGTSISIDVSVQQEYEPDYSDIGDPSIVDKLEDIYNDMNFAYAGWLVNIQDGKNEIIDYVYSRQNKLDALTQTMELTDDLFWRVGFINNRIVQIGRFGKKQPYIFSTKPAGETNIQIIEEPTIDYDFENVINVATVYSDKSDSGMSSLTLRDVYERPQYQKSGFPVVILHANVNNERDYSAYIDQPPTIAPNNELEYAVLDEASIALESGMIIEGTYSYNDMSPFELDGKKVKDSERIRSARMVYDRTVRKLIQARRSYDITIRTTAVPADIWVGDRVRLLYDNSIWQMDKCSSYWKKILAYDDWFYISKIQYDFDENEVETCEVTLTKWLKIERETWNE